MHSMCLWVQANKSRHVTHYLPFCIMTKYALMWKYTPGALCKALQKKKIDADIAINAPKKIQMYDAVHTGFHAHFLNTSQSTWNWAYMREHHAPPSVLHKLHQF